jgi:hypothetical protein
MLPPLVIGTLVQCINMPLVRATITIQNPKCELQTVGAALRHIHSTRGIEGTPKSVVYNQQSVSHTFMTYGLLLYSYMEYLNHNNVYLPTAAKISLSAVSFLTFYTFQGLWHGVSAGILKTVPKYVTAIVVKDFMEDHLPHADSKDKVSKFCLDHIQLILYCACTTFYATIGAFRFV